MRFLQAGNRWKAYALAAVGVAGNLWITGCGTPGAPQAPSLNLPDPVSDLTAVRAGSLVTLHWTMPRKNTDRLLVKGPVLAAVCRREGSVGCQPAGTATFAPEAAAEFHDTLPAGLQSGQSRPLVYFVELKNPKGRSAGLSNPVIVLAGSAPAAVQGLAGEVRADGVALRWSQAEASKTEAVRLHRKLLTPQAATEKKASAGPMNAPSEPILRDLLVESPAAGGALDNSARFGEAYEYTAQRVERVPIESAPGKMLELAGEISPPIRVDMVDVFPPAAPSGLVAVVVPEDKSIDLSWQPNVEQDLAGYIVYRVMAGEAENGNGGVAWTRISGAQPLSGPAYRDSTVTPGHSYRYSVSAIDLTGHESKQSREASETVPESEPNQ